MCKNQFKIINQPKLLIGEGKEEEIFFSELIKSIGVKNILVTSYGGKDNLVNFLETLPLIPGFNNLESLGITRDADNSSNSAFQSICSALNRNNFKHPKNLNDVCVFNNTLKISVFLLPNNKDNGMLEDLCLQSVANDLAIPCVESYFECVKNQAKRLPNNMAKAKIHAWLASKEKPDKRLGEAISFGYFDFNNSAFNQLKNFILSL